MLDAKLEIKINGRQLRLETGDITRVPADAIGNAANSELRGGGGVDGAIHRAGGPSIMQELNLIRSRIGHCPPGEAVATHAGRLPARWVLHAVGPVYRDGSAGEAAKLASCYRRCLELAEEFGARSLTLPAISTGVYGYPLNEAAAIAVSVRSMAEDSTALDRVTFVLFGNEAFKAFAKAAIAACA